ncbi:transcriptional regulator, AraC family [Rhizobium sp. PDO1-076]|uniref:helix-turn-helix transcriptional regulator n=1 Tax=Rhizobium sp. PDO1-076 TaxID=1125979 RepID=UPI00024E2542|nr:AraC family transcriptional regulator [Rhizobium sp. PDO1-076]EHS53816.1 transcriptional regulator, AraC family [Rhizobium sp. PDO1-076]
MDELAWIAHSEVGSAVQGFDGEGRIAFVDGPFAGFIERVPVRPGIALYRSRGRSSHAWTLKAQGDSPAGNLVLGTMLDGAGTIDASGNTRQVWHEPGRPFLLSLAERDIAYNLQAGQHWSAVTLLLEPDALEALAVQDGVPPLVRAVLDNGRLPVSRVLEGNRMVARLAQDLLSPVYMGSMGALWRESRAMELLAHQLDHLADGAPIAAAFTLSELARVRDAHQQLITQLRCPPSLDGLANQVRLSPRRLNQAFRHLYGMTVFGALLDARMKAASRLMRERTDLPLKHVAWMVGYRQLSNFVTAYRRRFGVSPGQHRRTDRID